MSQDKVYLSLDYKSGHLFESSKTPKEGFEAYTSSKGNTSYRKFYNYGVEGVLNNVSIRDGHFGKEVSIALEGNTFINFMLYDQKSNIDDYTEEVIKILPSLNKGDNLKVSPYRFRPQDSKYDKTGITFSVNGEKIKGLTNSYYKDGKLIPGDVPSVKWSPDRIDPTKKKASLADLEKKNDYLLEVLAKEAERLKWAGSGSNSAPSQPSHQPNPHQDDDLLPF